MAKKLLDNVFRACYNCSGIAWKMLKYGADFINLWKTKNFMVLNMNALQKGKDMGTWIFSSGVHHDCFDMSRRSPGILMWDTTWNDVKLWGKHLPTKEIYCMLKLWWSKRTFIMEHRRAFDEEHRGLFKEHWLRSTKENLLQLSFSLKESFYEMLLNQCFSEIVPRSTRQKMVVANS